jgi:hypothetical protein
MRQRWADPSYRWANDSELRRRYAKEFRDTTAAHKPGNPPSERTASSEAGKRTQAEDEA